MSARIQELAQGPRTSDPVDTAPWLQEVRKELGQPETGSAAAALAKVVDAILAGSPGMDMDRALLKTQLLAIDEVLKELLDMRQQLIDRGAEAAAREELDLFIGAVGLAYENLRTGSAADRATVEKIFARLLRP